VVTPSRKTLGGRPVFEFSASRAFEELLASLFAYSRSSDARVSAGCVSSKAQIRRGVDGRSDGTGDPIQILERVDAHSGGSGRG